MKKIQEIIKINRNSITHKINVDNNQIKGYIKIIQVAIKESTLIKVIINT